LYRDRGFTLAAIAMLTLAVALNASVFTRRDAQWSLQRKPFPAAPGH
jgi:hypothetical protein